MKVDKQLVDKIASLARLEFSEQESDKFAIEFQKILHYVEKVQELNTDGLEPAILPFDESLPLREDIIHEMLTSEKATSNAPDKKKDCFKVPRVVENN